MKLPCCIIEDEEPAVELLSFFIKQHPTLELKKTFYNPMQISDEFLNGSFLFFLDIQMPFKTGIDFLIEQQTKNKIPVILTTSNSQFGVDAYNLSVIDYLVKPYSKQRFNESVDKALSYFTAKKISDNEKYIWVTDDYKKVKIASSEILFIESLKQYVKIYTTEKRYMIIQTLKSFEDDLKHNNFIRCHKSFLINKKHVTTFNRSEIKISTTDIPIGKQYLEDTLMQLNKD